MSREAIDYVVSFLDNNPSYEARFKYTNCCDEIFFRPLFLVVV